MNHRLAQRLLLAAAAYTVTAADAKTCHSVAAQAAAPAKPRPSSRSPCPPRQRRPLWAPRQAAAALDGARPADDDRLLSALSFAASIREATRLLLENRAAVASHHLLRAVARMGHLQRWAGHAPPAPANREAFAGALEVAFEMLASEGRQLSGADSRAALEASAWMQVPPTPQQQAALEAALVAGASDWDTIRSVHDYEAVLASYLRLGLRPGNELAALLEPSCLPGGDEASLPRFGRRLGARLPPPGSCRWRRVRCLRPLASQPTAFCACAWLPSAQVAAADAEAERGGEAGVPHEQHGEQQQQQHEQQLQQQQQQEQQQQEQAQQQQQWMEQGRGERGGGVRLLEPRGLTTELRRASNFPRLLRLLVLHDGRLDHIHCLTALASMVRLRGGVETSSLLALTRQQCFHRVCDRALAGLHSVRSVASQLLAAAQLLSLPAGMGVPLGAAQQAAVEAVVARGLRTPHAGIGPVLKLARVCGPGGVDLLPGSPVPAALLHAAERVLPQVTRCQFLADMLAAWRHRGWPASRALVEAAQAGALAVLRAPTPPPPCELLPLLEAFTEWGWLPGGELAAELRQAVLLCLPTLDAAWVSSALSCCRKLGLLPDERLQWAFVAAAQAVLPGLGPEPALALLARLLMPLEQQVGEAGHGGGLCMC